MSYLISVKVPGDLAIFTRALVDRADDFKAIADKAVAGGALHHRFGLGDGYVHVVDEWESPTEFEAFFGEPSLQEFIASVGGDTSVPPEIVVSEAIESPDRF
jgi:hypothetical protein